MATPINQSNWIYGIGDGPMANYQDDAANPASLFKFVTTEQQAATVDVGTANNENESTGNDWATEQWQTEHDVNIPFSINPSMKMLRRILYAALGFSQISSPVVGVTKEIMSPMDANVSRKLPAYWMSEKCGVAHDALYPSCVLEKATFKGEDSGKLNVSGNFRASGRQILGANVPIDPETNKYYLKNTMSKVVRAAAANAGVPVKTYACGLQSWMLDVDNACDPKVGYDPGCGRFYTPGDEDSGIVRSYHLFGRRKYTGQFVVWLENSAPELALLRSQTPINLKMGMTGKTIATTYKNMLEFEVALGIYKSVVLGNKNGFTTLQISPDAFYNESTNKIVNVTLQYAAPA